MPVYHDADYPSPTAEDFEPSPSDRAWASAAGERGVWMFSKTERLSAVLERCLSMIEYLARERCDCYQNPPVRRVVDRRLHILRERVAKLRVVLRGLRLTAKRNRTRQVVSGYLIGSQLADMVTRSYPYLAHDE